MGRLDRARDELQVARERAGAPLQEQLETLEAGILEEESGDATQTEPGPKIDRVVEVKKKLDGLEDEADERDVRTSIGNARDLLEAYLKNHPGDAADTPDQRGVDDRRESTTR